MTATKAHQIEPGVDDGYPLTLGQQTVLLDPLAQHRLVSLCIEIDPPADPAQVLAALDLVLAEHPGLVTRLREMTPGVWQQRPHPVPARHLVAVRDPAAHDIAGIALAELDRIRADPPDPRRGWGLRGALTPTGRGAVLVLVAHHLLMDALSRPLVLDALDRALRQPAVPVTGDPVRALVARQQTRRADGPSEAARTLADALTSASRLDLGSTGAEREQPAERETVWLRSTEYEQFRGSQEQLRVTPYALLLTGLFVELAVRGASPRPAVTAVRTRRVGRAQWSIVGTFSEGLVLTAPTDLDTTTAVADVAREVASTLWRGLATKDNLVDLLPVTPMLRNYFAGAIGPVIEFQYIDVAPSDRSPRRCVRDWYEARTEVNFDAMGIEDLHIVCADHGDAMEIAAWSPRNGFPPGHMAALLRGLIDRALAPDRPRTSTSAVHAPRRDTT